MFSNIKREHLLKAIEMIDRDGVPSDAQSTTYDVVVNGKFYPPKLVVSFAGGISSGTNIPRSTFHGGKYEPSFKLLRREGFQMIKKSDYVEQLIKFINQAATGSLRTALYRQEFNDLKVKVSFGQGASARVPWIGFFRSGQITTDGIYPVYLYYKSLNVLILAKGISESSSPSYDWGLSSSERTITDVFSSRGIGKPDRYGDSLVYKFYDLSQDLDYEQVEDDLGCLLAEYKKMELSDESVIVQRVPLPKPFLLLAGISGTGKTRFVREQARVTDSTLNNYCLVPVRPDWHEPSDLLGYTSRLSGHAEYVITDVLTFIVKAWQDTIPDADKDGMGAINDQSIPYWLCLDEMNLAPVEHYFADYLSVLESREFDGDAYRCEALLNKGMLQRLNKTDTHLQSNLGLDGCDDIWQYFLHHGISLPPNLIVAGTVNMDETTHGFSRKVIDRAITLDFGEFFPNVYADYFEPTSEPVVFTWSASTHCTKESLASAADKGGAKSIEFLEAVNSVLKRTPFELAYRALNELLLQVACLQPESDSELQAIWDDFLMTKVLPRIDGDEDKLRSVIIEGGTLLDDLSSTLETNLSDIWSDKRKDYFRIDTDSRTAIAITCRSKAKLEWMTNRLAVNTFTSYWP